MSIKKCYLSKCTKKLNDKMYWVFVRLPFLVFIHCSFTSRIRLDIKNLNTVWSANFKMPACSTFFISYLCPSAQAKEKKKEKNAAA
jgi:hypothetical protein